MLFNKRKIRRKKKSDIGKLSELITKRDRYILVGLLLMTILLSIIETVGISAIMPFITFASNPSSILTNGIASKVYDFLGFDSTKDFMFVLSGVLIFFYIFRASYNILYTYAINRFALMKNHYFSSRMFEQYIEQNYLDFTSRNTDEMRRNVTSEATGATTYIKSLLFLVSEFFTITLLYFLLLLVNWKMTIVLSAILIVKVFLVVKTISKAIEKKGNKNVGIEKNYLKVISSVFGNFKIIKIKNLNSTMKEMFYKEGFDRAKLNVATQTLSSLPKGILETIGFSVLIASVAYILYKYDDASSVIPIISMYALALYRMLPSINKILDNYNAMKFQKKSLDIVYRELCKPYLQEGNEKIEFNEKITLKNITFGYSSKKMIIQDFSLEIKKGEKVAFIGRSGAGKSTLIDIIIGIYSPNQGQIFIDDKLLTSQNIRDWRSKIGYIPQSIYLFDGSVAENIAFGSEIDEKKVIRACKIANIYDFLEENRGIKTKVGDGGIKLSGGQRQRIGIARAVYEDPEILVLDEATSALDTQTESNIMDEIYEIGKNKTLLVIAHRLSTIEKCDRRITVSLENESKDI